MEILHRTDRGVTIISIGYEVDPDYSGGEKTTGFTELDIDNHYVFLEMIDTLIDAGKTNILVNLENVSYIDSSGLGALFDGYRKVTSKNGAFSLCHANKDVKRVLEITKISKKIKGYETEDEAISSMQL